ncbi:unnamed protein product [Acanthosepion pharaonis]|uniref:Uncharacterized protein n=1 Tax=Acanthosepion pharaonis TaxID=158019 RepID=A0A812DV75_ACAPH|nr:unnamed protein product [Sepia pharaonis]
MHGGRPHSSPAPMINAQLIPDRHSFTTATVLVSLNPWARAAPLHSITVLVFFFFPKVRLNPYFPRMFRWGPTYLPQPLKVSTKAFTFLSPSNTLQVKSGPSFSKRYTCAFLLPVCSLPSPPLSRQPRRGSRGPPGWGRAQMTLFSRTSNPFLPSIRVKVVPFGVVHLSLARTGSSQVTRSSTPPTNSLLITCRKVPDHTTCPASQSFMLPISLLKPIDISGTPTSPRSSVASDPATLILTSCQLRLSYEKRD